MQAEKQQVDFWKIYLATVIYNVIDVFAFPNEYVRATLCYKMSHLTNFNKNGFTGFCFCV